VQRRRQAHGGQAGLVGGGQIDLGVDDPVVVVGRVGDTEHFRNVLRHNVRTVPSILAVRVDESLYFANSRYLEDQVLARVAEQPAVRHLVLICSAVNTIDSSALETLERLIELLAAVRGT